MFDKYRIIRHLGDGGSGTVYLAEHIKLNAYRAIKCIKKDNPLYNETMKEAHILKNLKHLNIPIIYDIEEDQSSSYIIEEYFEGESLQSYRQRNPFIQEDIIINYSMQICKLLEYLHQNERPIIHLDLKPENIMVSNSTIKLIDFGTAIYMNDNKDISSSIGTIGYASPEQYIRGMLDERSDIYSIGMIIFYLITGHNSSECKVKDMLSYLSSLCSKKLAKIVIKCIKHNSRQRYQSVTQVYIKLSELSDLHKKSCPLNSQQSLKISFAGSQRRIGTTHTALLFTSYLNRYIAPCVYSEKNRHPVINSIIDRNEDLNSEDCILSLYDCRLECRTCLENKEGQYPITVVDYGKLTDDNLLSFNQADIKVVILGAKDWELVASETVIKKLIEFDDIVYLFNFMDGASYKEIIDNMLGCSCCRIPYIVNPWIGMPLEGVVKLVKCILGDRYNATSWYKIPKIYLKRRINRERI